MIISRICTVETKPTSEVDVKQQTDKPRETDKSENAAHFKEKLRRTSRIKVSKILKLFLTVYLPELKTSNW